MIDRYKENQQKYKEIKAYIANHSEMSNDLKKELLDIVDKYRALIFGSEQQEIYELIDECIKDDSKRKLQRTLHSWIFGHSGHDSDAGVGNINLDRRI